MSSALLRQALEFVDQEGSGQESRSRRAKRHQRSSCQVADFPFNSKIKKSIKKKTKSEENLEQNLDSKIKSLLALSKPTADHSIADKIVQRAITGKPLLDKIEIKIENEKSILFPDEEPIKKSKRKVKA